MNLEKIKKYFLSLGVTNEELREIVDENRTATIYELADCFFKYVGQNVRDNENISYLIIYINKYLNTTTLDTCVKSLNHFGEFLAKCNIDFNIDLYDSITEKTKRLENGLNLIISNIDVAQTQNIYDNLNNHAKEILDIYCEKNNEVISNSNDEYLNPIEDFDEVEEIDEDELENVKVDSKTNNYLKALFGTTSYDMKKVSILSDEETYKLATEYRNNKKNVAARNELIIHNVKLVFSIAYKFSHVQGIEFDDLISEGIIGLLKAAEKYNPDKAKFSTYATWWIKQTIFAYINDNNKTIRIPRHKQEEITKYLKTRNRLYNELKRNPTDAEMAEELKVSEETIIEYKCLIQPIVSLNETVGEDEENELGDFIKDEEALSPEEKCINNCYPELDYALSKLKDEEKVIMKIRYGLYDGRTHTLEDTARLLYKLGYKNSLLTRERLRQIESRALKRMHDSGKSYKIAHLLPNKIDIKKGIQDLEYIINNTDALILYEILNNLTETEILFLKDAFGNNIIGCKYKEVREEESKYIVETILPKIRLIKEQIITKIITYNPDRHVIPSNIYYFFNYTNDIENTKEKVNEIINELNVVDKLNLGKYYDISLGTGSYIGTFEDIKNDKREILYLINILSERIPLTRKKTKQKKGM